MRVLGINAIFRHPMPALVADGQIDAAAEELLGLPSHGKPAVPFPVGQPERATWWCDFAGSDRDAVAHWHHAASTHPAAEFRPTTGLMTLSAPRPAHAVVLGPRTARAWPHLCATSPTMRSSQPPPAFALSRQGCPRRS